jgi:intracellular multiplication protein IcmE
MAISDIRQRLSNAAVGTTASKRLLVTLGATVCLAAGAYYFYSGPPPAPLSTLPRPAAGNETVQGKVPPTLEMSEQLGKANVDRYEISSQQGGSAMPTLEAKIINRIDRPAEDGLKLGDDDKVVRPPPVVVERPQIVAPVYPVAAPVQAAVNGEPDKLVDDYKKFLMTGPEKYGPATVQYLYKGGMPGKPDLAAAQAQAAPRGATAESVGPGGLKLPLPGTIVYAQMVSTANSDTPGPVIATIVEGNLAGATLIGSFQTQREGLYISFKTLSMGRTRDGDDVNKAIPINAVGVDSVNVGTGIATDVDRHILQNVGVATAAAFAQGFGQAIGTSGQAYTQGALTGTTVINPTRTLREQLYIAGGTAGGAAGPAVARAYGNRPTTVTVAAGTPVGILFLPTQGVK